MRAARAIGLWSNARLCTHAVGAALSAEFTENSLAVGLPRTIMLLVGWAGGRLFGLAAPTDSTWR